MATLMHLRSGAIYRLDDGVTLQAVNDTLAANAGRFFQVPLHSDQPLVAGKPQLGTLNSLFVTPEAVSHFEAVTL